VTNGLKARVPCGKDGLRHNSNNPEHLSFPVTIVMNVLVIMAVKTRPRLQSKYNILLACLAGTDLLVGAASQPNFNSGECLCHKRFISIGILPILQGDPSDVIYSYFCTSVTSYTY